MVKPEENSFRLNKNVFRYSTWVCGLLTLVYLMYLLYFYPKGGSNFYLTLAVPFVLLFAYAVIYKLEWLMMFSVFSVPLSVSLKDLGMMNELDLSLPSEPLMVFFLVIFFVLHLRNGLFQVEWLRHPVTRIILLYLAWMLVTSAFSSMPLVSIKYFLSQCWLIGFSYGIMLVFMENERKIRQFLFLYLIPLLLVIIYTVVLHAGYGFNDKVADWIMSPFYNDHTAYAAAIALMVPPVAVLLWCKGFSHWFKLSVGLILLVLLVALILSFSRAAWLSLIPAFGVGLLLIWKVKFRWLLGLLALVLFTGFLFQDQIVNTFRVTDEVSEGDFMENLYSVANVSSDASNVERLNRWSCALKMTAEKPMMGFGPGTYMFQYAPYQSLRLKTVISTNSGSNGNAHSEYLGPLCEMGFPGLVLVLMILIVFYYQACRLFHRVDGNTRWMVLGIIMGITTYYIHGFLNNFLNSDKLALPFWGFMAALVVMDIQSRKQTKSDC